MSDELKPCPFAELQPKFDELMRQAAQHGPEAEHWVTARLREAFKAANAQPTTFDAGFNAGIEADIAEVILNSGVGSAYICDDPEEAAKADALEAATEIVALFHRNLKGQSHD